MSRPRRAIPLKAIAGSPDRRAFGARGWVTILALLAFFLQSLAVQTHIHQPAQTLAAKTVAGQVPVPAPLKAPDPIDQCRLCQEMVHSGVFVAPSASAALAGLALTTAVFAASPVALVSWARAFDWQSRAPPRR
jgi:hypothetical protein